MNSRRRKEMHILSITSGRTHRMTGPGTGPARKTETGRTDVFRPIRNNEYQNDGIMETRQAKAAEDIRRAARSVRELSACRLRLKMSTKRTNNIADELEDLARALFTGRDSHRK